MIPARRMKFKVAPNILGGLSKKDNSLSNINKKIINKTIASKDFLNNEQTKIFEEKLESISLNISSEPTNIMLQKSDNEKLVSISSNNLSNPLNTGLKKSDCINNIDTIPENISTDNIYETNIKNLSLNVSLPDSLTEKNVQLLNTTSVKETVVSSQKCNQHPIETEICEEKMKKNINICENKLVDLTVEENENQLVELPVSYLIREKEKPLVKSSPTIEGNKNDAISTTKHNKKQQNDFSFSIEEIEIMEPVSDTDQELSKNNSYKKDKLYINSTSEKRKKVQTPSPIITKLKNNDPLSITDQDKIKNISSLEIASSCEPKSLTKCLSDAPTSAKKLSKNAVKMNSGKSFIAKNKSNTLKKNKKNDSKENINNDGDEVTAVACLGPSKLKTGSKVKVDCSEKKIFNERKQQLKQKLSQGGNLEPSKMTMFDLIFWNPSTNPMTRSNEKDRAKKSSTDSVSTQRQNSVTESESFTSETQEELNVEEDGLENNVINSSVVEKESTINQEPPLIFENEEVEIGTNFLAPQIKIGPDGELIIDEKSLLIQTTAAKNRDKFLSNSVVVEENDETSHYGKWSKRRKRATEWTKKETARFYKALSTVGTDFSLMATVFSWRTRAELKIKFKKEERINRHLIDTALNDCTQFDFSIFDESDYDPEEDRKESKEAEKAEAKKRKEMERCKRIEEKKIEKKKKKDQADVDKIRKKKLREVFNNRKRKRKGSDATLDPVLCEDESNESTAPSVSFETQEVVCEVVFASKKDMPDDNAPVRNCRLLKTTNVSETVEKNQTTEHNMVQQSTSQESTEIVLSNISLMNLPIVDISKGPCNNQKGLPDKDFFILPIEDCEIMDISCETISEKGSLSEISETPNASSVSPCSGIDSIQKSIIPTVNFDLAKGVLPELPKMVGHSEPIPENSTIIRATSPICLPISSVQINSEGSQFVEIQTAKGLKSIPVPPIPPLTSNIVIAKDSKEQIFDIYFISPMNTDSSNSKLDEQQVQLESSAIL